MGYVWCGSGKVAPVSVLEIKAWMASHVFLTIGIAIALTVLLVVVARDALNKFYLRLVQLSGISVASIGVAALVIGAPQFDQTLLSIGGACLALGVLTVFGAWWMYVEYAAAVQKFKDEIKQSKDNTALRLVLEPAQAKGEKKS